MEFRILGSLSVVGNGKVAALGPPKQRALLAILLTRIGEVVPVERLVELLWGEAAPRTADHSIQIYVSDLRRAFEPLAGSDRLATRQAGYVLEVDPDSVDAWRFERLVKEGMRLIEDGEEDAGRSTIDEALGLWTGPPLSDFPYNEFAQPVARRLTEVRLTAVEAYAAASLDGGRITEALDLLTAAVQDDPLRERARELLMLALYRSGRHADALRSFHALRTQLTDEFGVDPSPSIRALYDRILAHDPSLGKGSLAAPNVRVTLACEGAGVGGDRLGVERGFDRAVSDFSLVPRKENVELSTSYGDWSAILRELSEQAPALVVSLNFVNIDAIAREHTGTRYLAFDHVGAEPNVSYVHFHEREASFLAGAAAALTSQTGIVGFIGGWDAIPIWGFLAGYEAGARATNGDIRLLTAYAAEWPAADGFVDLDQNEELARQMFADGADVILAASGPAGMGVVSAAASLSGPMGRQLWVIGVDTDWYDDLSHNLGIISPRAWRSHVLTSVRKRFDLAVYEALQRVATGGRLPPVKAYDLRSRFVDISYEGGFLDDVRPLIEDQRRRIVSGQLRVPCLPAGHVEVARAHLEQSGVTLDDWRDQGCRAWRLSVGSPLEDAGRAARACRPRRQGEPMATHGSAVNGGAATARPRSVDAGPLEMRKTWYGSGQIVRPAYAWPGRSPVRSAVSMFRNPQIILFSDNLPRAVAFYAGLGFVETFRVPTQGEPIHVDLSLDGYTIGIASVASTREDHGLDPIPTGQRAAVILWTDDTEAAFAKLTASGAAALAPPHAWLGRLLIAWVADPDGNPIQLVQNR